MSRYRPFPGFISFGIFKHLALVEKEFSDLEIVSWTIFLSLILYAIFLAYTGNATLEGFQQQVFGWQQASIVILLAVAIGGVPGLIIKFGFRRGSRPGKLWDYVIREASKGAPYPRVRVHTEKEIYEGIFFLAGRDQSPKEILIVFPMRVTVDCQGKESTIDTKAKEMYFREDSIKQIDFLDEVTFDRPPSKRKPSMWWGR